jgi:hypothetical protein
MASGAAELVDFSESAREAALARELLSRVDMEGRPS